MVSHFARLAMLLLALGQLLLLAVPAAAQSYEQALTGFAADSFNDTDTAIVGVAGSGNPLAAMVIGVLSGASGTLSGRPAVTAIVPGLSGESAAMRASVGG